MRKQLSLLFGFFLLAIFVAGGALAIDFPKIISGEVSIADSDQSYVFSDFKVSITGMGDVYTAQTDGSGKFTVIVNKEGNYQVKVCDGLPECVRSVYASSTPVKVKFNFSKGQTDVAVFSLSGGLVVLGGLLIFLFKKFRGTQAKLSELSKVLIREVLELAPRVTIGKLKDVKDCLDKEAIDFAITLESGGKKREDVLKFLKSL